QSLWRAPDRAAIAPALTELFPESSRPLHVLPALEAVQALLEALRTVDPGRFERAFPADTESLADLASGEPDDRALGHVFPPAPKASARDAVWLARHIESWLEETYPGAGSGRPHAVLPSAIVTLFCAAE